MKGLFGNETAPKVLLLIEQYGETYAKEVADTFDDLTVSMAQRQLERFETEGLLVSVTKGRTRLFTWNPRYPYVEETRAILQKAVRVMPDSERKRYFGRRQRPRRRGKPL